MGIRGGGAARQIRALFDAGAVGSLGDGELLGRFLGRGDSADPAFAALVDRHNRMVHRVCLDVLGDPHEAQDAAQATFFILARQAAAIRNPEALPSWLHGTARRVAARALRDSIRRRRHERRVAEASANPPNPEPLRDWSELHEELARLPNRYRDPIVLCDLTGLTHEEAAGKLGCPPRTLETRLYRGRERLKDRLIRRGVAPSAMLVGLEWAAEARASLTTGWVASTAEASARLAKGGSWAGAGEVPARSARLAREHLKEMSMIKLKWAVAAGVLFGMAGGAAWSRMSPGGEPRPEARVVEAEEPKPAPKPKPRDPFERAYALADGEDVKALKGPAIEARNEHYRGKGREIGMGYDPGTREVPLTLFFRWRDEAAKWYLGTTASPPKLRDLFGPLMDVKPQEVEGDPGLLDTPVDADFLVRDGAKADRIVHQIESILRRDFHLPIRLSLKDVFRDVIVVGGRYRYRQAENAKLPPDGKAPRGHLVEISTRELGGDFASSKDQFSSGAGFPDLLSNLGLFLGLRVVDEVRESPQVQFDYTLTDFRLGKKLSPEERAQALKTLAEQTGLTFTEEPRGIRVLRVEKAD